MGDPKFPPMPTQLTDAARSGEGCGLGPIEDCPHEPKHYSSAGCIYNVPPRPIEASPRCDVHCLKTWPFPFADVRAGRKPFEYRKFDRDFRVGDVLLLQEWDPDTGKYSGDELRRRVTYLLPGGSFGVPYGYCVMGLEVCGESPRVDRDDWFKTLRAGDRVAIYREGTISQFVGMKPYLRWDDGEHDVIDGQFIVPCLAKAKVEP